MNLIKRFIRKLHSLFQPPISDGYTILDSHTSSVANSAWLDSKVAQRQDIAYQPLLKNMYDGKPRRDLSVLADSIHYTGISAPTILEVGCGSGYYSEVLDFLLHDKANYIGVDFSDAMIRLAKKKYPQRSFLVANAMALPIKNEAFDIVVNGTALMHILDYTKVIYENSRVAKSWCIFHTVPIIHQRQTTVLQKRAYGEQTIEIIFNESALLSILKKAGLKVEYSFDSIPYDLTHILQEKTTTKTYVCRIEHDYLG